MNIHPIKHRDSPRKTRALDALAASNSLTDLAARIRHYHEATVAALRASVIHAMDAGDLLIEAKAQLKHGLWLPWLSKHCVISERTAQVYIKLAKHQAVIEKQASNPQFATADLSINEALALCALAGRIDKLMAFAKRADVASGDDLVKLCTSFGFDVIADEEYDQFAGRSEIERRDWMLFGWFIGGGSESAFDHVEWILRRAFQNVDEWLGPEGDRYRASPFAMTTVSDKCREAWKLFHAAHAHMTEVDIIAELQRIQAEHDTHQKEDA